MEKHETVIRLFDAAKTKGKNTPAETARLLNISQQTLKNWESRGISAKALPEVAQVLGVSETWLRTGEGSRTAPVLINPDLPHEVKDIHRPMMWSSNDPLPDDDYVFVPYLKESCFKGGAGAYEIPDYNGYRLPFGKSTLRRKGINPDNVFCCTLTGDSMEEKIAEDAAIAVDTGETAIRDGKIYAFAQDGMFRVKYLIRQA
ncbi:XRE family transcriptional regulator, partial [Neisseria gonorrhoeae]|uniref:XRE family transcriptional regulator n=1 Tax=Neisseria gonorrhoeae TaxID=485 RepID=UPI00064CBB38